MKGSKEERQAGKGEEQMEEEEEVESESRLKGMGSESLMVRRTEQRNGRSTGWRWRVEIDRSGQSGIYCGQANQAGRRDRQGGSAQGLIAGRE